MTAMFAIAALGLIGMAVGSRRQADWLRLSLHQRRLAQWAGIAALLIAFSLAIAEPDTARSLVALVWATGIAALPIALALAAIRQRR